MARTNPTAKKRQRENKLREKAQLKRERRQQRRVEKKDRQTPEAEGIGPQSGFEQVEEVTFELSS
jgi:hypothetical protein